jgi:hypothetical protein
MIVDTRSCSFMISRECWDVYSIKYARMVELVDTRDLKSLGHYGRAGSSPALRTNIKLTLKGLFLLLENAIIDLQ